MKGSMAKGSRRMAAWPIAAAVASEPIVDARNTPWARSRAASTSGKVVESLPPNRNAEIGTPVGSSQAGSYDGHWVTGAVNRELGCAAGSLDAGVQSRPFQSMAWAGGGPIPSHHTSPASVRATLVKMQLALSVATAFGLLRSLVPGATAKNPASGLMARSVPSGAGLIQAMSSPTVVAFHPSNPAGGTIIARLVLPQALGNAAPT